MSAAEATTWTATSARSISAAVLKWAVETHSPVQSVNWQTWAVTLTIPTVNDATLTIQKNGTNVQTFTANQSTNATANITVPTDTSDLTNGAWFITGITSWDVTTALWYTPANDSDVVKTSWNQTVAWTKTFSTSPVVPSKTTDATNTWTAIATEAQVYKKQDKLTTQTAYTSKWTSTKVPTITTNTLWQVTAITETSIAFPAETVVSWDSWITYTIKVSNSEPWAWTPATTITFVTA
jgi:hypothetical protein